MIGHAIADDDEEIRASALFLFAEHGLSGNAQCVEELKKHLHDESAEIRRLAASSLANTGSTAESAVCDLIEALTDSDEWVAEDAAYALNSIGTIAWDALRNMDDKKYVRLYNELLDGDGTSIEY